MNLNFHLKLEIPTHANLARKFRTEKSGNLVSLLESPWCQFVEGELYSVSDEALSVLDKLEGYPGYYNRVTVDCRTKDIRTLPCFIYRLDRYIGIIHSKIIIKTDQKLTIFENLNLT